MRICWERSTSCFIYSFLIEMISKKTLHFVAMVLLAIWEIFLYEYNRSYNFYRFSYKFGFILFLSFLTNQKQESGFQQVGGLATRNISVFCLERVALYIKAMPNSINFYKEIFLHVISVHSSNTNVFLFVLWILRSFKRTAFYGTPQVAASVFFESN